MYPSLQHAELTMCVHVVFGTIAYHRLYSCQIRATFQPGFDQEKVLLFLIQMQDRTCLLRAVSSLGIAPSQ